MSPEKAKLVNKVWQVLAKIIGIIIAAITGGVIESSAHVISKLMP